MAERAIRSVKTILKRLQYQKNTNDWPSLVELAADMLNNRIHSAIGLKPVEVTAENSSKVFAHLYPYLARNEQPPTGRVPLFRIGDEVRILTPTPVFTKGFQARTSAEIYRISRILFHSTIRYKLSNINSADIVAGSFTANELILTHPPQRK